MKKYDGVVLKAQMYEYKKGIDYAKPQTRLYKWLRGLYTLVFVYTFLMNLFFVCGMLLNIDAGRMTFSDVSKNIFIVILITFVMGFVITISEPDLQVLAQQVPSIPNMTLILAVAAGKQQTSCRQQGAYPFFHSSLLPNP